MLQNVYKFYIDKIYQLQYTLKSKRFDYQNICESNNFKIKQKESEDYVNVRKNETDYCRAA